MGETENQKVRDYRKDLLERAKSKYPDRNFDEKNGENGESAQTLEQAIWDMLDEDDNRLAENKSKNETLVNLFLSDPSSAEFINRWVETGDPRMALVEVFGDDLADLATEEGRGKFSDSLKSWRERRDATVKSNAEADANWDKSLEALEQWGNSKGMNVEQKTQVLMRLFKIVSDGIMNVYSPEDFDMVLKEMNYDKDVEAARSEGKVAGRNEKIEARKRSRAGSESMPPALSGGQGMSVPEEPRTKANSPWSGIK